jgi:hypothetical protein
LAGETIMKWYLVGYTRTQNGKKFRYNTVLSETSIIDVLKDKSITIVGMILFQVGTRKVSDAVNKPLPF